MLLRFPTAEITVDVARTRDQHTRGLAGCAHLPEHRGMLFEMGITSVWPFTMRGVSFPLDMIFVDGSGVVVGIVESAPPGGIGPYGIHTPSRWVLEANGGWARRHGVKIGDRMSAIA
jgi:uncharacterized membrane protein (UPF0127 family)